MDLLNQLITIMMEYGNLGLDAAREVAEQIIDVFQNGDDVTNNTGVTIQQIQQVLAQVENQSNQLIIGRIVQSQQALSTQLNTVQNSILNYIRLNIVNSNTQIMSIINQVRTDIAVNSQIIRTQIITSEFNIINRISQLPSLFQAILNQHTQIILRRIDDMTNAISQVMLADIRSEQEIASLLNRTLIGLFGNLPSNLADELYDKFQPLLDREPETPLQDLLPQIQETLKNSLIESYASNEFKEAIHPVPNNLLELIRTIFGGVDAASSLLGQIVNTSSETGSLIVQIANIIGVDDLFKMAINMAAEPFLRHIYNASSRIARSDLLSSSELLNYMLLNPDAKDFVIDYLKTHGYKDSDITILLSQVNRPISEDTIQQLYYRNELGENIVDYYLGRLGYNETNQANIRALWDIIPPVQDIIRMAVRDVFNQPTIEEFGLSENMPQPFIEWAKKQGLSEYWSRKYWQAHWSLPSLTQGYEMFQRQIISEEQLKLLMQALDIPPTWRDYLIQMNYSPITRVDVRRMHDMGFLTPEQMTKRYRDVGYSPIDAQLLTEWTIEYNSRGSDGNAEDTRKLTQTVIIRGFTVGLLTQVEAISQLTDLGYSAENAQYLLDLASIQQDIDEIPDRLKDNYRRLETIISKGYITGTYSEGETRNSFTRIGFSQDDINSEIQFLNIERETQLNQLIIDLVKTKFVQYQLTEDRTQSLLAGYGFNNGEINALIGQWSIIRMHRDEIPTKTELVKMLDKNIITINQAQDFLRGMGYSDETIILYTRLWTE